ncbi:MAG TPA: hypothetical protein V6D27_16845 [Vampirovibrionales bacterium]
MAKRIPSKPLQLWRSLVNPLVLRSARGTVLRTQFPASHIRSLNPFPSKQLRNPCQAIDARNWRLQPLFHPLLFNQSPDPKADG